MMVSPSSMRAFTIGAHSSSVSGFTTTNGYSTRQSVASVTCETRAMPSNWMLSLRVEEAGDPVRRSLVGAALLDLVQAMAHRVDEQVQASGAIEKVILQVGIALH